MDFGIARAEGIVNKTQVGMALGTPDYMAPEQVKQGKIDARTDVYSLSVVLFYMACGRLPFIDDNPYMQALKHVNDTPPPPRSLNPEISHALEEAILTGMAKDQENRFPTAEAFANILDRILAQQSGQYQSQSGPAIAYQTNSGAASPAYTSRPSGPFSAPLDDAQPPPAQQQQQYQQQSPAPTPQPNLTGQAPATAPSYTPQPQNYSAGSPTPNPPPPVQPQRVPTPDFSKPREEPGAWDADANSKHSAAPGMYTSGEYNAAFSSGEFNSPYAENYNTGAKHKPVNPPAPYQPVPDIYDSAGAFVKFLVFIGVVFVIVFFVLEFLSGSNAPPPQRQRPNSSLVR
jgi:serine/threonine protein kinase